MSLSTTLLLGFIAGATIVFGLPVGRMRRPAPGLRVFLNATAVGVLLFLFWDVLAAAWEPIETALEAQHSGNGGMGPVIGYGSLFVGGLSVGLLGLVAYDRYLARAGRVTDRGGRGSVAVIQRPTRTRCRHLVAGPPAVAADRGGNRFAQLRRRSGHRSSRGQ